MMRGIDGKTPKIMNTLILPAATQIIVIASAVIGLTSLLVYIFRSEKKLKRAKQNWFFMERYTKQFNSDPRISHRYRTYKGEISLLFPCFATMYTFEIFCCEGDLFEDVERYRTFRKAENRIYELLEPKEDPKAYPE